MTVNARPQGNESDPGSPGECTPLGVVFEAHENGF
jgi:hypothetical protein